MVIGIMIMLPRCFLTLVVFFVSLLNIYVTFLLYLVKNPLSSIVSIDISISLKIIKCRYPNCQPPPQPGLELPATIRPSNALYWSNDSDWSFALEGYGGYGKY
jgi:hypothetical protein